MKCYFLVFKSETCVKWSASKVKWLPYLCRKCLSIIFTFGVKQYKPSFKKIKFLSRFIKIRCHFYMLSVDNFLIFILKPVLSAGCVAAPRSCHTPPPSLYLLFLNFPFIIYAFPTLLHTLWNFLLRFLNFIAAFWNKTVFELIWFIFGCVFKEICLLPIVRLHFSSLKVSENILWG